jgi:hypothetical protein
MSLMWSSGMTTPRDLLLVSLDVASGATVEQGELSLALAGAELLDLLDAQALTLDGDLIQPGPRPDLDDRLLDAAVSSLVGQEPYESVEDWLWRRGRGLAPDYFAVLAAEGAVAREHHRWMALQTDRTTPVDSPARRHAAERWASGDPVLVGLAAAVGIYDQPAEPFPDREDDPVATVLAAVNGAVVELAAIRQRRSIEEAAFDNIWRVP